MTAKKIPNSEKQEYTRRDFLKMGLSVLSGLAVLEMGVGSVLYLRAKSLEGQFGGLFVAGKVDEIPDNSVTEFSEGNFYLVRGKDGGFMALYRRCPHLGCAVEWSDSKERFYCPCHASSFDMNGDFVSQPVPKALDLFEVSFRDGQVVVDTSKIIHREHYAPDQIVYYQL